MILHLIRHPPPQIEAGLCYGRLDIPAENVALAARRLASELPPGLPVYSSPLRRCLALAEQLHPAPVIDARLQEMDFGDWEGRPWDSIARGELDAWAADVGGYAPPGGESPLLLQQRVIDFVNQLVMPEAVVVTHAGVIRVLLAHVQSLPPERWLELDFSYGSRTVVDLNR